MCFISPATRLTTNAVSVLLEVLILLTNDSTGSHGPQKGKLRHSARKLIHLGVKVVPVAIRDRPVVEDLEDIASENRVIRTLLGDHIKLAKRLSKGTESRKYSSIIFRKLEMINLKACMLQVKSVVKLNLVLPQYKVEFAFYLQPWSKVLGQFTADDLTSTLS